MYPLRYQCLFARHEVWAMNKPKSEEQRLEPCLAAWSERMLALAHEIEAAATQRNWYVVEYKAMELVTMCAIRRTR